jgi:hypothetical protein
MVRYFLLHFLLVTIAVSAAVCTWVLSLDFWAGIQLASSPAGLLAKIFFISGPVGAFLTDRWFAKKNLWMLYRNLRISRAALLIVPALLFSVFTVTIIVLVG